MEFWIRKLYGHFKQDFMNHTSSSMDDSGIEVDMECWGNKILATRHYGLGKYYSLKPSGYQGQVSYLKVLKDWNLRSLVTEAGMTPLPTTAEVSGEGEPTLWLGNLDPFEEPESWEAGKSMSPQC